MYTVLLLTPTVFIIRSPPLSSGSTKDQQKVKETGRREVGRHFYLVIVMIPLLDRYHRQTDKQIRRDR